MKKVGFYVKGEEHCSVMVKPSQDKSFTELMRKLCSYAARSGFDVQFSTEESDLASDGWSLITGMEAALLDGIHGCIESAGGEIKEKEEDGWVLEHDTDVTLYRIFQGEDGVDYVEMEDTYDGIRNKIRLFKLDIYNLMDIYSWAKEQLAETK